MEVSVISIMNNAYHFNLYIKGNPLIKGTLSCSLSALYIQVWLYLYVFRINFTPKIVLHMMKSSILLSTTNCASEYVIYKRINKTENTFLFNQVSWCLIYIITISIQRVWSVRGSNIQSHGCQITVYKIYVQIVCNLNWCIPYNVGSLKLRCLRNAIPYFG